MAAFPVRVFPNLIVSNSKLCRTTRIDSYVSHFCLQQTNPLPHKSHKQDSVKDMKQKLEMARSKLVSSTKDPASAMEMLDLFQQLGIDYLFGKEIEMMTRSLNESFTSKNESSRNFMNSLYHVALGFRLLRQHGYYISPDVFRRFMNKKGDFEVSLRQDIRGLLSLYEASHMDIGEDIMWMANRFSMEHLKACIDHVGASGKRNIEHTLEKPIHLSLQRNTIRHHICQLKGDHGINKVLKELSTSDFNSVQSLHRRELSQVLRWWTGLDLSKQPQFFRDQPMKWFAWTVAMFFEPQFSKHRLLLTKVIALVYTIDDIFDVFGSLEELIQFTEAIERWENSLPNSLPSYMKICYHTLHNITNEIASFVLYEHGWNPIDALRKSWASLCKAFLVEIGWFTSGTTPKATDYLENGVTSTGVHVITIHFCFLLGNETRRETTAILNEGVPKLIELAALNLRLLDDLGNAKVYHLVSKLTKFFCLCEHKFIPYLNDRMRTKVGLMDHMLTTTQNSTMFP